MRRRSEGLGAIPLTVCALILTVILIFIADAARLFMPERESSIEAELLLEALDAPSADALLSETALSLEGGIPCEILHIGERTPQSIRTVTRDGRILSLPSAHRFSVSVTLRIKGKSTEDGFLAGGSRRLLAGSTVTVEGKRMSATGQIRALTLLPA
ncbi:MAG: DUF4330 family protein [Clostridia bacterium]|nr:DUF4330 family protein [Clostridia bacterium]